MDYFIIALRTLFISFLLMLILRKKGMNPIRSTTLFDGVLFMMIAIIAVIAIQPDYPLIRSLLSIAILLAVQSVFPYIVTKMRRRPIQRKITEDVQTEGHYPIPLIIDGKIQEDQLKKINKTPLWIRQQMRTLGYRDVKKISYCAMKSPSIFFVEDGQ